MGSEGTQPARVDCIDHVYSVSRPPPPQKGECRNRDEGGLRFLAVAQPVDLYVQSWAAVVLVP